MLLNNAYIEVSTVIIVIFITVLLDLREIATDRCRETLATHLCILRSYFEKDSYEHSHLLIADRVGAHPESHVHGVDYF